MRKKFLRGLVLYTAMIGVDSLGALWAFGSLESVFSLRRKGSLSLNPTKPVGGSLEEGLAKQGGNLQSSQTYGGSLDSIAPGAKLQPAKAYGGSLIGIEEHGDFDIRKITLVNGDSVPTPFDNDINWQDFGTKKKELPLINLYYYSLVAQCPKVISCSLDHMPLEADLSGDPFCFSKQDPWNFRFSLSKKEKSLKTNQVLLALYKPKHRESSDTRILSLPTDQKGSFLRLEVSCKDGKFKKIILILEGEGKLAPKHKETFHYE